MKRPATACCSKSTRSALSLRPLRRELTSERALRFALQRFTSFHSFRCKLAQENGWGVMVSHRSGETEDTFIADLVVGLCTGQVTHTHTHEQVSFLFAPSSCTVSYNKRTLNTAGKHPSTSCVLYSSNCSCPYLPVTGERCSTDGKNKVMLK